MLTRELEETLSYAVDEAVKHKHEYVTLEHLLFALLEDTSARDILHNCGAKVEELAKSLEEYFRDTLEIDAGTDGDLSINDPIRDPAGGRQRAENG
jgi:ATP-dependent Clp protease ATP-binding subunit ClpA